MLNLSQYSSGQTISSSTQLLITSTIQVTTTINSTIKCYVCDVQFPNNQLYFIDQCQFPTNKSISVLTPLTCNSDQDTCMVIDAYNNKTSFLSFF
jgi:hypothetical protein